ncbi:unnamed protein product [Linum trigynum]|uniref:Uncharacterized protein n=1 Tax=Linum trigynum TaxID=586398 RepID=A0AAV2FS06_9ROSI
MVHAISNVPLDFSYLLFGVFMTYGDTSYPGPLPFGPSITQLVIRLGIPTSSFRTELSARFLSIDQVLDQLELANEGEMAADEPEEEDADMINDIDVVPEAIPEENPEEYPVAGEDVENVIEDMDDLDGDSLDQFAAALAFVEEGFYVAAAAAVAPGGLSGGLVDYSSDDESV